MHALWNCVNNTFEHFQNHPNPEPPIRQGHDNRLAHFEQDGRKIQGLKDGSSFKHHEKKGRVHSKRNESDQKKSGLENSQISDNGQQLEQQLKSMLNINSETSGKELYLANASLHILSSILYKFLKVPKK